jgi:CubicO group peptidase (beta-lactamase class C family)
LAPAHSVHELPPRAAALAQQGIGDGLHFGVQVHASIHGRIVIDAALGEARPGMALSPETINLWMSAGKPVGAVALAQLRERGLLDWDRPVAAWIPEFAARGKAAITPRHLLTHSGGFRLAPGLRPDLSLESRIRRVCEAPLEPHWEPGRTVGYHPETSWHIVGELVRRIDGRPYEHYVREEIFLPLGMENCRFALADEVQARLGDRMGWMFKRNGDGPLIPNGWESPESAARCIPGATGRGPARELVRLYEALLAGGRRGEARILSPAAVAELIAVQFENVEDKTFRHRLNWSMGLLRNGGEISANTVPYGFGLRASPLAFGHGGRESTMALADPVHGLALAVIFNGMPGELAHQRRMRAMLTTLYEELGLRGDAIRTGHAEVCL